jgi:hypothetical protein
VTPASRNGIITSDSEKGISDATRERSGHCLRICVDGWWQISVEIRSPGNKKPSSRLRKHRPGRILKLYFANAFAIRAARRPPTLLGL